MSSIVDSKKKRKAPRFLPILLLILSIFIVLITGIYIGLCWQKNRQETQIIESTSIEEVQEESDSLYRALQGELDFYKDQSDSLYPEISTREEELDKHYIRLQNLIKQVKQDKSSDKDIKLKIIELQTELSRLRAFVDDQTLTLAEMRRKNANLIAEKVQLENKYAQEVSEKANLKKDYDLLKQSSSVLSEKVNKASILQLTNVSAIGAKLTRKGTDKATTRAKRTEFIKVCFDIVRNEVVRPGINKIYMRITDPNGWPIVVESRGSGKIPNVVTNKEEFYTTMKSFNYNPDLKSLCLTWSQIPSKPLQKGSYLVELFNKGYPIASTNFELR